MSLVLHLNYLRYNQKINTFKEEEQTPFPAGEKQLKLGCNCVIKDEGSEKSLFTPFYPGFQRSLSLSLSGGETL